MKELSIEEALCILHCGWTTGFEKELYLIAFRKVNSEASRLHSEYQLSLLDESDGSEYKI